MTTETKMTEAESIATIMRDNCEASTLTIEGTGPHHPDAIEVLVLPTAQKVQSIKPFLDEYRTAPERRKGTAELTDLASFIAHVKRFSDDDSVIFADSDHDHPALLAVLDYNPAGSPGAVAPRFGEHRARYAFPLSDAWQAWTGLNKTWLKVEEFASFLEAHLADVTTATSERASEFAKLYHTKFADAAHLLELSRGLSVRINAKVEKHVNLSTGEGQVTFAEEHVSTAGTPLNIPGAFTLAISVFRNDDAYVIPVRLRYRVAGGSIAWQFDMHRLDTVFDDAIRLAGEKAGAETGRAVLYGRPEA